MKCRTTRNAHRRTGGNQPVDSFFLLFVTGIHANDISLCWRHRIFRRRPLFFILLSFLLFKCVFFSSSLSNVCRNDDRVGRMVAVHTPDGFLWYCGRNEKLPRRIPPLYLQRLGPTKKDACLSTPFFVSFFLFRLWQMLARYTRHLPFAPLLRNRVSCARRYLATLERFSTDSSLPFPLVDVSRWKRGGRFVSRNPSRLRTPDGSFQKRLRTFTVR